MPGCWLWGAFCSWPPPPSLRSDFFYYWVAGWMLLSGISPHDPDAWPIVYRDLTGAVSVDHAFPYPPWTVLPVLPLALLDPAWAATLWLAASLGALGAAALSVLRDVPPDRHLHATGIGALALAGFAPLVEALFFGQLSPPARRSSARGVCPGALEPAKPRRRASGSAAA